MSSWTRYVWTAVLTVLGLALLVLVASMALRVWGDGPQRADAPTPIVPRAAPSGEIVHVEVRNGTMRGGAAGATRVYLIEHGFDVVASGNWTARDEARTRVLDRVGNPEAARRVARALGLDESRIEDAPDGRFHVDATVVLGGDLDDLPPFRTAAP
jgi:hypothetical protein